MLSYAKEVVGTVKRSFITGDPKCQVAGFSAEDTISREILSLFDLLFSPFH